MRIRFQQQKPFSGLTKMITLTPIEQSYLDAIIVCDALRTTWLRPHYVAALRRSLQKRGAIAP